MLPPPTKILILYKYIVTFNFMVIFTQISVCFETDVTFQNCNFVVACLILKSVVQCEYSCGSQKILEIQDKNFTRNFKKEDNFCCTYVCTYFTYTKLCISRLLPRYSSSQHTYNKCVCN